MSHSTARVACLIVVHFHFALRVPSCSCAHVQASSLAETTTLWLLPAHLHVTDQLCLHLYVIAASMCVNACICSLSITLSTLLSPLLQNLSISLLLTRSSPLLQTLSISLLTLLSHLLQTVADLGTISAVNIQGAGGAFSPMVNTYGAAWEVSNSPAYPISLEVTSGSQTVSHLPHPTACFHSIVRLQATCLQSVCAACLHAYLPMLLMLADAMPSEHHVISGWYSFAFLAPRHAWFGIRALLGTCWYAS